MATKQRWMGAPHLMKLVPKDAARNQEPPGGSGDKTDPLRPRRHSSHVEKLQAQLSELELEKETLTRHLCSTKVKLQRLESTEVDSSSLNEAHRALTNMVKSQQESHRREIRELQGQLEGLTLANRQLREMQLVASASSPQGQALGEIQKRYNQEVVSLKEQLGSMEKSLQALEIKNKQLVRVMVCAVLFMHSKPMIVRHLLCWGRRGRGGEKPSFINLDWVSRQPTPCTK